MRRPGLPERATGGGPAALRGGSRHDGKDRNAIGMWWHAYG
jgi:hypothetical protein